MIVTQKHPMQMHSKNVKARRSTALDRNFKSFSNRMLNNRKLMWIIVPMIVSAIVHYWLFRQTEEVPSKIEKLNGEVNVNTRNSMWSFDELIAVITSIIRKKEDVGNAAFITHSTVEAPDVLKSHTKQFKKQIQILEDNVYVALGYGLANVAIISGSDGVIVIDTMESVAAMTEIWEDWLKMVPPTTNKTVKAVIYTHFHTDHTFGTESIYEENITKIYAHTLTKQYMGKTLSLLGVVTYRRSMRQFGVFVEPSDFENAGIGLKLNYETAQKIGYIYPSHVFSGDMMEINEAGIKLLLIHAEGESKDHTIVWYGDKKMLFGGDNIYKAFPNLYAIRGSESRDCTKWIASLDKMIDLKPNMLILGHTEPITNESEALDILTTYRDAIQYVHDQTVRLMNKGYSLDATVREVKLPQQLAAHPYLQELYGTVEWSVRGIYTGYLGWFNGESKDLFPLNEYDRAMGLVELSGGKTKLFKAAADNYNRNNYQWSLELVSAYRIVYPEDKEATALNANCLRGLAAKQTSAAARNWYLTSALEVESKVVILEDSNQKNQIISKFSLMDLFSFIPTRINPLYAYGNGQVLLFRFGDTQEQICLHFRNWIAFTRPYCETKPDAEIHTDFSTWKAIIQKKQSAMYAFLAGNLKVHGSYYKLALALYQIELNFPS